MRRRPVLIIAVCLVLSALAIPVVATKKKHKKKQWPDLTTISVGNKMCSIDGAAQPGSEKAKLNDLKNRFRLPSGSFSPITFDELLALNQGHIQGNQIVGFPGSSDSGNKRRNPGGLRR